MIRDLIKWLEADSQLQTLLQGNAGNKKIFPIQAPPGDTTPYILYFVSSEGSNDSVLEESMITLTAYSEIYDNAVSIAYRLSELLDVWEDINITSDRFYIYYSRKVGGVDTFENDTRLYSHSCIFHIKYKRKNGG